MHERIARLSRIAIALLLTTSFSTSCASLGNSKPPIVSSDTSCIRYKHISADDAQRAAMATNMTLWRSLAVQVADHNDAYDKACK